MPYSMQLTEQIPNDPLRMGAKGTTTSNHPSTAADPGFVWRDLQIFNLHTIRGVLQRGSRQNISLFLFLSVSFFFFCGFCSPHHHLYIIHFINWLQHFYCITISLKKSFVPKSDVKQWFTTTMVSLFTPPPPRPPYYYLVSLGHSVFFFVPYATQLRV